MYGTNGLARLLPDLTKEIELSCGTKLVFHKVTIGDLGEKEQFIVSRRPALSLGFDLENLFPLLKAKSKELAEAVLLAVKECVVASLERPTFATNEELYNFEASPTGQAFDLWLTLRKTENNRVSTLEDAALLQSTLLKRPEDYRLVMEAIAQFSYDCLQAKN